MKTISASFLLAPVLLMSCNSELQCARFFIPTDFMGKMTIYFNKKNGQKEIDREGCIVYRISEKGECFTAFPFEEGGWAYPHKTYSFFEVFKNDSTREIPEFDMKEYLTNQVKHKDRKYVFYHSSGYENPTGSDPNYILVYYVDLGKNHNKYGEK